MNQKPNYRNVHNRFKLNGNNYSFNDLFEVAYSFIKEGKPHEKVIGDFLMDWLDPKEELIVVSMTQSVTNRNHFRMLLRNLVYQAIN